MPSPTFIEQASNHIEQTFNQKVNEHVQEQTINAIKKQIEKPVETLAKFYFCYCLGNFIVSIGIGSFTGAISGILVATPAPDNTLKLSRPKSISQACESVGVFFIRRAVSCMNGAFNGALHGAFDSATIITAPWARLFKTVTGTGIKKPVIQNEAASQTDLIKQEVIGCQMELLEQTSLGCQTKFLEQRTDEHFQVNGQESICSQSSSDITELGIFRIGSLSTDTIDQAAPNNHTKIVSHNLNVEAKLATLQTHLGKY